MRISNLTAQQKDQLLEFFAYYLPQDLRWRLMAELPRAYNAWCGTEVVRVHRTSDGAVVAPALNACEAQHGQRACHAS
jgi:hypothetical protein